MRPIKFRAWDKEKKEMLPPLSIDSRIGLYMQTTEGRRYCKTSSCYVNGHFQDQLIWLQFTGLKDKNGVEIYEGDIIEEGKGNGAVEWLERRAAFGYLTDTATIQLYGFCGEVIGNIYENPELLSEVR